MEALNGKWIVLGKTQLSVDYLKSVSEEEALAHYEGKAIHADRVRNAWKQANNFKDSNSKKKEAAKPLKVGRK